MCHTLEAMHFGIVELWSTFFCSDSSKASASISPASEASATYLFLLFLFQKREKNHHWVLCLYNAQSFVSMSYLNTKVA